VSLNERISAAPSGDKKNMETALTIGNNETINDTKQKVF